jgi:DNA repair exonuclease SbcCD ATPase subunit
MPSYDEAVQALYRAPLDQFVAERKRLSDELKASEPGSAKLFAKLPRPSVSAWATNQLWWRERDAFEELFETGERLRAGELEATAAHRKATNRLVTLAGDILRDAGHGASEATLRRVSANLGALAAQGGFEPDQPGALRSDRDPPGFGALEGASFPERAPDTEPAKAPKPALVASDAEERARAQAERKRVAEEQARLRAERKNAEGALRAATAVVETRGRERERLAKELAAVDSELEQAQAQVERLTARLRELDSAEAGIKVTSDDA